MDRLTLRHCNEGRSANRGFRRFTHLLALICLVAALLLTACGGGGSKEEATTAPTRPGQVATSTPQSTPGVTTAQTTAPPECAVPEVIQQVTEAKPCAVAQTPSGGSDGARVTLNNILDPYVDASIFQATPAASMRFIAIEATVEARSGVRHFAKFSNFTLVDTQGNTYQLGIEVEVPGDIFSASYVTGDKKYRGWVRFEVPETAVLSALNYDVSGEQIEFRFQ